MLSSRPFADSLALGWSKASGCDLENASINLGWLLPLLPSCYILSLELITFLWLSVPYNFLDA